MKCSQAQSLMLDHLYGELEPRREKAFLKHVQTCDACSRELQALKSTASVFSKLDMEEPPDGLSRRLSALAASEVERPSARRRLAWYWKPALAATAAAVIVVITFVAYEPQREMTVVSQRQAPMEEPATMAMKKEKAPADAVSGEGFEYREKGATIGGEQPKKMASAVSADESLADHYYADKELQVETSRTLLSKSALTPEPGRKSQVLAPNAPMPASESRRLENKLARKREDLDKLAGGTAGASYPQYSVEAKAENEGDNSLDGLYQRGTSYEDEKHWEEAAAVYERIIEQYPDSPMLAEVYFSLGDCYMEMGKIDDAISAYETARDRFADQSERAQQKIDAALARKNAQQPSESAE